MYKEYSHKCVTCFLDDRDVSQTKHNNVYNAGLAQRNRLLSNLRRPHAQNLEVRYNLQSENSYLQHQTTFNLKLPVSVGFPVIWYNKMKQTCYEIIQSVLILLCLFKKENRKVKGAVCEIFSDK